MQLYYLVIYQPDSHLLEVKDDEKEGKCFRLENDVNIVYDMLI